MRFLATIALAALLAAFPRVGAAAIGLPFNLCEAETMASAGLDKLEKEGKGHVLRLSGPGVQRYLKIVNETPPETTMEAERLLLFLRSDGDVSLILISDNVACIAGKISFSVHEKAFAASKETPA